MTNRRWILLLIIVLLSCAAVVGLTVRATTGLFSEISSGNVAIPTVINYQGYLTTPTTGQPVTDGNYQMTFRLYDAPTGGTLAWQEQQLVAVSGGLFNVLLGKVTPFTGNEFEGSERWLEVQFGNDVLAPRQPLAAVPYAFQAANAGRLQGLAPGDITTRISSTGKQTIPLSGYPGFQPLAQVIIDTPGPGTILVEATGTISIPGPGTYVDLGISKTTNSVEWIHRAGVPAGGATGDYFWPFAVSHVYEVTDAAGDIFTYFLNGRRFGENNTALVELASFRAIYFPAPPRPEIPATQIVLQGLRMKPQPFNVSQDALQTPGGIVTMGVKAYDATGPTEPFMQSKAYRLVSSPKPGTPPYIAKGISHTGFKSLTGIEPSRIEFDFSGAGLVETSIQNITGEGPIPLSDPRLKATNNLVYFRNADASGHRSEKRTYVGGTFRLWNNSNYTLIAEGTIDYINIIIDYDGGPHSSWGEVTVTGPPGSLFQYELIDLFNTSKLTLKFTSLQSPVSSDAPLGTTIDNMYAVFNVDLTIKPKGNETP
jgi:hypothetical protein